MIDMVASSQDTVAALFGCCRRTVQSWCRRGMPHQAGSQSQPGHYDLPQILQWVRANVWEKQNPPRPRDADPLLSGDSNSPALEEYRREKAKLARMDRLEREGQLIHASVAHEASLRIARVIRSAGDRLQKEFGPEAHEILEEALDDADREIDSFFGQFTNDDDDGLPMRLKRF